MNKLKMVVFLAVFLVAGICFAADPVLISKKVDSAPTVDGTAESIWDGATAVEVDVVHVPQEIIDKNRELQEAKWLKLWQKEPKQEKNTVTLKSVHTDSEIFFLAQWPDKTKDDQHKTYHWDKEKEEYIKGKEREDRFVFNFLIKGEFDPCMISPKEQVKDIWHWKAARTNGAGLAHDKSHILTLTKPARKAGVHYLADGTPVYIIRPSDGGVSPYKPTTTFKGKEFDELEYMGADAIPAYTPFVPDVPDAIDVKAKGIWSDDKWNLEIGRRLQTDFKENDAQFTVPSETPFAIAVFDHVGDQLHLTSQSITLKIE